MDASIEFPDIPFADFNDLIQEHFSSNVSLSVVLVFLFSVLRNPALLSLHFRRKFSLSPNDQPRQLSNWGTAMAEIMLQHLPATNVLPSSCSDKPVALVKAMEALVELAQLEQYTQTGGSIPSIDESSIEPCTFLTPTRTSCRVGRCAGVALKLQGRERDIPNITLIRGTQVSHKAYVIAGTCLNCKSIYYTDHSTHSNTENVTERYYTSTAPFLKIGQSIWVDRQFSSSVLNGLYSFASASSFVEFWLRSFWPGGKLTRRHIWQSFVQTSVREVAGDINEHFIIPDKCNIAQVVQHANVRLTKIGSVPIGDTHKCDECSKPYQAPQMRVNIDPAATLGIDRVGQAAPAMRDNAERDAPEGATQMQPSWKDVRMRVIDGIVMGPLVS